jgi:hypothetical protein
MPLIRPPTPFTNGGINHAPLLPGTSNNSEVQGANVRNAPDTRASADSPNRLTGRGSSARERMLASASSSAPSGGGLRVRPGPPARSRQSMSMSMRRPPGSRSKSSHAASRQKDVLAVNTARRPKWFPHLAACIAVGPSPPQKGDVRDAVGGAKQPCSEGRASRAVMTGPVGREPGATVPRPGRRP